MKEVENKTEEAAGILLEQQVKRLSASLLLFDYLSHVFIFKMCIYFYFYYFNLFEVLCYLTSAYVFFVYL